ncbi:hypothetical protein F183_A00710 [Bryobacterales bacterium F-183]|nr:hypothetical protein F183_A00710 [Bryobacterales bacterium F-183]
MRLRFALFRCEAQMFGLLFVVAILQNGFPTAFVVIPAIYVATFGLVLPAALFKAAVSFFVFHFIAMLASLLQHLARADPPSGPTKPISDLPAIKSLTDAVCDKLGKPRLRRVVFGLAPGKWDVAQRSVPASLSSTPQDTLPLPLLSLAMWSVTELEAYVAQAVARRRSPQWLLSRAECAVELLARSYEHDQTTARHGAKVRAYLLPRLLAAFARWVRIAEMRADFDAAIVAGPSAVMSCVILDKFVTDATPVFLNVFLAPALAKGEIVPLAESFAAFVSTVQPKYVDEMRKFIVDDLGPTTPVPIARLSLLAKLPVTVHKMDPRSALSLLPDLQQIELEILAYEAPILD